MGIFHVGVLSFHVLLGLTVAVSENRCPKELVKSFQNVTLLDYCDGDCRRLNLEISAAGWIWKGFCVENRPIFVPNPQGWIPVRERTTTFVRITRKACYLHRLNDVTWANVTDCLERHKCAETNEGRGGGNIVEKENSAICHGGNNQFGEIDIRRNVEEDVTSDKDQINFTALGKPGEVPDHEEDQKSLLFSPFFLSSSTTATKPFGSPPEDAIHRTVERSQRSTLSLNNSNYYRYFYYHPEDKDLLDLSSPCEYFEGFFNNSCYSVKAFKTIDQKVKSFQENDGKVLEGEKNLTMLSVNATESCKIQQSGALGLAVESKKENRFVMEFVKNSRLPNTIVLTSGIKPEGASKSHWEIWNFLIDSNVIGVEVPNTMENMFYVINTTTLNWQIMNLTAIKQARPNGEWFSMCKSPINPKKIRGELFANCNKLYRESGCYNPYKFIDYCCAIDEYGELWLGCPDEINVKMTKNGLECSWYCGNDGIFVQEYPVCRKETACQSIHNLTHYAAPAGRHAISPCPMNLFGYSSWYCNPNKTFSNLPTYVCCKSSKMCKATDPYLNIWMSCPGETAIKNVVCPPNSLLATALVDWHCNEDAKFNGSIPNYANCNQSTVMCFEKDKYDREWRALGGTMVEQTCPGSKGEEKCYWKCNKNGLFDTSEPDCSECSADWTYNITEQINNGTHYKVVMNLIEKHTRVEDLTMGFRQVLNVTAACVDLFKRETGANQTIFNSFLVDYSKILKNVAGRPEIWSTFLKSSRRRYTKRILEMTQTAAFSYLLFPKVYNESTDEYYNATLTDAKSDGFDFFVLYGSTPKGVKFPLENYKDSDWQLEVENTNGNRSNFAAMGLIMNYSLSYLMFPSGNKTADMKINSPVVTFTLATSDGVPKTGRATVVSNVSVLLTFKHASKTRYPRSEVIRRRLHEGESPTGVYGSTVCHYFSDTDWSTEGCSVTQVSEDETKCTCTHLSTIGLLMSLHRYEPDTNLEVISYVCSAVTIIALILTTIVFLTFDSLKNERILIGTNLCVCLTAGHFLIVTVMDKRFFYIPDSMCTIYAVLLHYVFMAAFLWMFLEGCHLYRMLVLVFESSIEFRFIYIMIGYGAPALIVGLTELIGFILSEEPYGQDEACWLKTPNYIWAFIGPVILLTSVNFVILVMAMKLAISSNLKTDKSNFNNLKIWIKGCFSLSALLGITWLFGLGYIEYNQIFAYSFVILNGLQGFFIFFFRCVCNVQYKNAFLQKLKACFAAADDFNGNKKPSNVKSVTNLFAITPSGRTSGSDTEFGLTPSGRQHGNNNENVCSNCLKFPLFKSNVSDVSNGKRDVVGDVTGNRDDALRSRFPVENVKTDFRYDVLQEEEIADWRDANDFPELSYHTSHYSNHLFNSLLNED